ncbi:MAG: glutathione S-transferase family protein [Bdellovibrionales bacterium]
MLTVHHLEKSRSHRVIWLLEELGIPYELKIYKRDPKTLLAPPELKKIHPLGKSPVITDGSLVVAESGAILEYLVDKYGKGRFKPEIGTQEFQDYRYFLHYTEGSLMPYLVMSLVFNMLPQQPVPFFMKPVMKGISEAVHRMFLYPNLITHFEFLENHLKKSSWFAGPEMTATDIQISFALLSAESKLSSIFNYPKLKSINEKFRQRPAFKRALEKGGPIEF